MPQSTPAATAHPERPRILSGMRPTGRIHLGNYMGALYNWVQLQNELQGPDDPEPGAPKYDCFFFIADWHALTTDYADPSRLKQNVFEIALDLLAAGLDPERSTIFVQSHVPQHAELNLLLSMITPVSWLERVPTYKDQQEQLREKDLATFGFLGYPLLQSADILLYRPKFVPVGADQVAHIEITREIARRFNFLYGPKPGSAAPAVDLATSLERKLHQQTGVARTDNALLPEPEALLTPSPKLPGLDGRKMSKSYANTISLTDLAPVVDSKIREMTNGGQRLHQADPGNPDICPVGDLHAVFSNLQQNAYIRHGCRTASIGCLDCKGILANSINHVLSPIRERRQQFETDPSQVFRILDEGAMKARETAKTTMKAVRAAVGFDDDYSGVKFEHTIERVLTFGAYMVHDLTKHADWLQLAPIPRNKKLREYWLEHFLPVDKSLKVQDSSSFLSQRGKRVLVLATVEENGAYSFTAPPKTYEVLVLALVSAELQMRDLVIPQAVYVAEWSAAKKRDKKSDIPLRVRRVKEQFFLTVSDNTNEIDVSKYVGAYDLLA